MSVAGPGGGLFVAAPSLEDVASTMLMYLALAGETYACIEEFRMLVWRAIVNAAICRHAPIPASVGSCQWGFAVDLAQRGSNATMVLLARLAEMLAQSRPGRTSPAHDNALELAIQDGDLNRAYACLDDLAGPVNQDVPIVALEVATQGFSLSGRKSAMAMAMRMARELGGRPWGKGGRMGNGRTSWLQRRRRAAGPENTPGFPAWCAASKAAKAPRWPHSWPLLASSEWLAPCIAASSTSAPDNRDIIFFLISCAPVLAARRVKSHDRASTRPFGSCSAFDPLEALTLENFLLDLSGNPILSIVVRSLGLATIFVAGDRLAPQNRYDVIATNRRILQAIEAGDVETAGVLASVKLDAMQRPADSYWEVA